MRFSCSHPFGSTMMSISSMSRDIFPNPRRTRRCYGSMIVYAYDFGSHQQLEWMNHLETSCLDGFKRAARWIRSPSKQRRVLRTSLLQSSYRAATPGRAPNETFLLLSVIQHIHVVQLPIHIDGIVGLMIQPNPLQLTAMFDMRSRQLEEKIYI